MKTIKDLKPSIVWHYFHEITQIPRPSKKEEKIVQYLIDFAKEHKLAYKKDEVGNVLISKPATTGHENKKTVILQSHVDMVCEKNSDKTFNFDTDPIQTIIDNGWVRADGTTLGADNGIGVATELAILTSKDIEHGPIECLFTIDEETGLTGAMALKEGFLTGEILLNLDSEDEGELFIGCAGGEGTTANFNYKEEKLPKGYHCYKIDVTGLKGGHSGGDIHIGLGNANKLLARYLYELYKKTDFALCSITGGNLHNAIAREAHAVIGLPDNMKETATVLLNRMIADVQIELKAVDPNVKMKISSTDTENKCIDPTTARNLIYALYACPHGVMGMSHEIEGLVETSTNLASVKMLENNIIQVGTSQRSSTESLKHDVLNMVSAVFSLAGAEVAYREGYPGWRPNPESPILKVAEEAYKKLFSKEPKIKAIHAGLECGLFLEKYPYLDMVSFGPTMRDVHSPNERLEIDTVPMFWEHLLEILKNIPTK